MRLIFSSSAAALLLIEILVPRAALASWWEDPKPPMRWEEMVACELVVAARYERHAGDRLFLRVESVLRGSRTRPGDIIPVALEHLYSVETGATGWESLLEKREPDGIPKLCYKGQVSAPGSLVPLKILDDVREPAIYFFRQEDSPALSVRRQVQLAPFIEGWDCALKGETPSLGFRLLQPVDSRLRRDALEELYRTREAQALAQLFDRILDPALFPMSMSHAAEEALIAIGDREGDVYDPLRRRLSEPTSARDDPIPFRICRVLASVDPARALKDFEALIRDEPERAQTHAAAACLGAIPHDRSMDLAFRLLETEAFGAAAVSAIRRLLGADLGGPRPIPEAERARLERRGVPLLREALRSRRVAEKHKRVLLACFAHLLEDDEGPIDVDRLKTLLRDGSDPSYRVLTGKELDRLLQRAKRVSDPRLVPILIETLAEVPEARAEGSHVFHEVFEHYAFIFRNAMRREIEARRIAHSLFGGRDRSRYVYSLHADVPPLLGGPWTLSQAGDLVWSARGRERLARLHPPDALVWELEGHLAHTIRDIAGPSYRYLDMLYLLDREKGLALRDRALAERHRYGPEGRCAALAFAVRTGRSDLAGELIDGIRGVIGEASEDERRLGIAHLLLDSRDDRTYAEYLRILDGARRVVPASYGEGERLSFEYERLLAALFPDHAADYFERVLSLLASDSIAERMAGATAPLVWHLRFDPAAFESIRKERLVVLRPTVAGFAGKTELEMRASILREHGVPLNGPPGAGWLPALCRAVVDPAGIVSRNALWLFEEISGEHGALEVLGRLRGAARERALAALVEDRGLLGAAPADPPGSPDPRDIRMGLPIPDEGYCDQPYVVVTKEGDWLCVLTTGRGQEGQRGQHVVSTRSSDRGKTWSPLVDIEPADGPEASWVVPLIVPGGRVYAFYTYNGDRISTLRGKPIRADMLGWYVYKYSDDGGRSWSRERYRLPMRLTACDRANDWKGEVQIFWGISKPITVDRTVFFAFTKLGRYMLDDGEGWVFRSENLLHEEDAARIRWDMVPDGEFGIRDPAFGSVQEEHNIVALREGSLYCVYRTTNGFPCHAYSRDGGRTWTKPEPMAYVPGGRRVKTPRACPKVWRTEGGRFLFWFHNHGGKTFDGRNPAWIAGGIERDGSIRWSQPEVLLYDEDPKTRMSYPDLIEEETRFWVTETEKSVARVHEIDRGLLDGLWSQGETKAVARGGREDLPAALDLRETGGLSIEMWLTLESLAPGQVLVDSRDAEGRGFALATVEGGTIRIDASDGKTKAAWDADPGLLAVGKMHHVAAIIDNGPKIISFVADGILCDGGDARPCGWGRFAEALGDVRGTGALRISPSLRGGTLRVRIYDRPLRTSEAIGNCRAGQAPTSAGAGGRTPPTGSRGASRSLTARSTGGSSTPSRPLRGHRSRRYR